MRRRSGITVFVLLAAFTIGCEWLAGIKDLEGRKDAESAAPPISATAIAKVVPIGSATTVVDSGVTPNDSGAPPAVFARHLALGSVHSCVLRAGRPFCWGSNANGQLGAGAPPTSERALGVTGVERAVSLVSGSGHLCAIGEHGELLCWGSREKGQLGGEPASSGAVVRVDTHGEAAIQVALGATHTCVLLAKTGVRCFGDNAFGQLGNGTRDKTAGLVAPRDLDGAVTGIFAGGFTTCALKTNGALLCWGDNTYGQLGNRTTVVQSGAVSVRDLTASPAEVGLGQADSCAISGGAISCWGKNRPLGDALTKLGIVAPIVGSKDVFPSATVVTGDSGAPKLTVASVGATHACGLGPNGVFCWGGNAKSQLSIANDGGTVPGFAQVGNLGPVREVAVGLSHSCALTVAGDVLCWGNDDYGQIGAAAGPPHAEPVLVSFAP